MTMNTVKSIRKLAPHIAQQIAAGEVVERPASIVKELIENSLDADANQISIFLEKGGLDKIQVIDNGIGIFREELLLALDRHSTSKIFTMEDIACITSLGFRGEALASISAVAHVTLTSRVNTNAYGFSVISKTHNLSSIIEKDIVLNPFKVSHPVGTTLEVKELFYNTPARRRFLRSVNTEFSKIQTLIKCFSLSYRNVGFDLFHNKKPILQLAATEQRGITRECLAMILNHQFAETAISIAQQEADLTLTGWISSSDFSRSQPDLQFFYVNRRLVKDKIFTHALKQAYQDILYRGRVPAAVLFLEIDPAEIDVNVHPAKLEIRFRQTHRVHDFIYQSLKKTLGNCMFSTNTSKLKRQNAFSNTLLKDPVIQNWDPLLQKLPFKDSINIEVQPYPHSNISSAQELHEDKSILLNQGQIDLGYQDIIPTNTDSIENNLGHALAQLHGIYILSQNNSGLIIVDAHAAHERILYEKLKREFAQNTLQIQSLLVPLSLLLTAQEIETVQSYDTLFKQLGFRFDIKESQVMINSVPQLLGTSNILNMMQDIISDLQETNRTHRVEEECNAFLSKIACRSAIHANRHLSVQEMNQLLRHIENTPHGQQCNHGRPTWRHFSLREIDTWFLRGR